MSNSNDNTTILAPLITAIAILIGATISLLQIDAISRYILSFKTTRAKRRNDILYMINEHMKNSWYTHRKSSWDKEFCNSVEYSIENELLETELICNDEDIKSVVLDIIGDGKESTIETTTSQTKQEENCKIEIIAIEQESANMEYYIYLSLPSSCSKDQRRRVQISLIKFSLTFQKIFDDHVILNTSLCFVSDGSCHLSNIMLGKLLSNDELNLGIVMEPLWMLSIAMLIKDQVMSDAHMQSIIFSLCRLEAWNFRRKLGKNKTVIFFLPGQCSVSILTPILQKVFKNERHVYSYDTCLNSISRALTIQKEDKQKQQQLFANHTASIDISSTTSITNMLFTSPFMSSSNNEDFIMLTSKLPCSYSNIVESWMNSIDTFLVLKEDEVKNGYRPFKLHLPLLYNNVFCHLDDVPNYDSDSFTTFCQFLQFVTGTNSSRPIQDELLKSLYNSFILYLKDNQDILFINSSSSSSSSSSDLISKKQESIIEQCVSLHERITSDQIIKLKKN